MPGHGSTTDPTPQSGRIITVTTDAPPINPKFVVDDSPLKASIITIFSLVFFGITLAIGVLRFASARDLNGLRALMMRDDTIGWFTMVWPAVGAPAWLWLRSRKTWFNKKREVEITDAADDSVAMTKTKAIAVLQPELDASPPTRARETVTRTRLVDPVILHRGAIIHGPEGDPGRPPQAGSAVRYDDGVAIADMKPVEAGANPAPAATYEDDARSVQDLIDRHPMPTDPYIPGDILDLRDPAPKKES